MNTNKNRLLNLDNLNIPSVESLKVISKQKSGLFIATGEKNSGKTTTLIAISQEAIKNANGKSKNILLLDEHDKVYDTLITDSIKRIELDNFDNVNKVVSIILSDKPDILIIREIYNSNILDIALKSSENGILVLCPLNSSSMQDAINKLYDICGDSELKKFILERNLLGMMYQELIISQDAPEGKVARTEIIICEEELSKKCSIR